MHGDLCLCKGATWITIKLVAMSLIVVPVNNHAADCGYSIYSNAS